MSGRDMLSNSALVVAHPDDEVIFFSSILSQVDKIVIAYLTCPDQPVWTEGRCKSISSYPLSNISCLEMTESNTFDGVDWTKPEINEYGLAINTKRFNDTNYKKNFSQLKERLSIELQGYKNIYSHNPWGEYGHAEHVQIYRALCALKKEMHFTLWFSNYCSNKSLSLMLQYLFGFRSNYSTIKTDDKISKKIIDIYKKNNCWTWYNDWIPFLDESFIIDDFNGYFSQDNGHKFPINFIMIESGKKSQSKIFGITKELKWKIWSRLLHRQLHKTSNQ